MTDGPDRGRVLLLVRHEGNRRRLREWVASTFSAPVAEGVEGNELDPQLVLADAAAFVEQRAAVDRLRADAQPVFLPCLLVCTPREAERLGPDLWRSVDDLVLTPIRPDELRLRIERLVAYRARTAAAEHERSELERSNSDLERFAFVVAHELVAPLAIVSGAVQTVAARFPSGDATARQVLDAAIDGARRMQELIENILDLSRVGAENALEPVDTQLLVDDVCEELGSQIASSGARVSYDDLPEVVGDPSQLRLVFRNLLANAIKFRRPGAAPMIEVAAERTWEGWLFCVVDDGVGISPEAREAVFELFARADARAAPGSGIGLAICRRVVDRLGGRIWFEPREGGGATVCFTIPDGAPREERAA